MEFHQELERRDWLALAERLEEIPFVCGGLGAGGQTAQRKALREFLANQVAKLTFGDLESRRAWKRRRQELSLDPSGRERLLRLFGSVYQALGARAEGENRQVLLGSLRNHRQWSRPAWAQRRALGTEEAQAAAATLLAAAPDENRRQELAAIPLGRWTADRRGTRPMGRMRKARAEERALVEIRLGDLAAGRARLRGRGRPAVDPTRFVDTPEAIILRGVEDALGVGRPTACLLSRDLLAWYVAEDVSVETLAHLWKRLHSEQKRTPLH